MRTQGRGRDERKIRLPDGDNHWLDCLVGASMQGAVRGQNTVAMNWLENSRDRKVERNASLS